MVFELVFKKKKKNPQTCHLLFLQDLAVCPQKLQTRVMSISLKKRNLQHPEIGLHPHINPFTTQYETPRYIRKVNKRLPYSSSRKTTYCRPHGFLPTTRFPCGLGTLACWSRILYLRTTPARLLRVVAKPSRLLASSQNRTRSFLESFFLASPPNR